MAIAVLFIFLSSLFKLAIAGSAILAVRALYRMTLHPLARFPGPKLAALTNLYGVFHDLIKGGDSSYVKKLPSLHDRYGTLCPFPSSDASAEVTFRAYCARMAKCSCHK